MCQKPNKYNLEREQKTNLFKMALAAKPADEGNEQENDRADILLEILASTLPADPGQGVKLPNQVKPLYLDLLALVGDPVGKLLLNPQAGAAVMERIKEFAKNKGLSVRSQAEQDAAKAVYYDAIANAYLFQGVKITDFSREELGWSFRDYMVCPARE